MNSDLRGYQPPPLDDENFPVAGSEAPVGGPPVETTLDDARRTYVQVHYERFAGVFARCDAVGGLRLSFGLAPFLFGELWFIYRKMYLEGLLLLAASLIISGYIHIHYPTGPEDFPNLNILVQLAAAILLGLVGKGLYWKATDRRIEQAMKRYPGEPYQALAWLDSVGGVNVPIVALVFAFKLVFYGVVMAIGASMAEAEAINIID